LNPRTWVPEASTVPLDHRRRDIEHLDIVSYLAALNRTFNEHIGTVYRIFNDFSDKGWLRRHTALYRIQAHGIGNTVQVLDPETGQVRKDEEDNLKIKIVVDWHNGAGFRRSKEYRSFFK
jgi:hypothetical protein